ncbi:hypothetical protein [Pedobacter alpinus]|uniref:Uncharacterized protein n=1 Tax=Pedobacter alpinus TaxID=1590643 RepID=A0ABW5TT51_9SPHI
MKNQKRNIFLISAAIILIAIMVYNSLSQPGIGDLKSEFKEITSIRNEQNDGPILRAYLVTIDSLNLADMTTYGNFMPHNKYGNTKVYFFSPNKPFPKSLNLIEPVFDQTFEKYCLAVYEKNGMGEVVLRDFN